MDRENVYNRNSVLIRCERVVRCTSKTMSTEKTNTKPQSENRIERWAAKINAANTREAEGTIIYAKIVADAKAELVRHGEWTELCRSRRVPFKKSKGDMLVFVGRRMAELNAQTIGQMPSGWSILHCLAWIPTSELQALVQAKHVTPLTTLSRAKELAGPYRPTRNKGPKSVEKWLERCHKFIEDEKPNWDQDQAKFVADTLVDIAEGV